MVLVQFVRVKHGQCRSDVVPVVAGVVVKRDGRGGAQVHQAEESTEEGCGDVGQHDDATRWQLWLGFGDVNVLKLLVLMAWHGHGTLLNLPL